jgi:hypothetical protein
MAVHGESLETVALSATVLILGTKLLQLDKCLIIILLLLSMIQRLVECLLEKEKSYFSILARNLDIVVFSMRVFDQVVAHSVQRLYLWTAVQVLLISVFPSLQAPAILWQIRSIFNEVLLKFDLVFK